MKVSQALVKGSFSKDEAKEIIRSIYNSKIQFHRVSAFSLEERTGIKPIRHLERIRELNVSLETLLMQIESHANEEFPITIDCQVQLDFHLNNQLNEEIKAMELS